MYNQQSHNYSSKLKKKTGKSKNRQNIEEVPEVVRHVPVVEVNYCICRSPNQENMIGCENGANCPIEWYHLECVGLEVTPKGDWFCPKCIKTN